MVKMVSDNCGAQPQCLYALKPEGDHNRGVAIPTMNKLKHLQKQENLLR